MDQSTSFFLEGRVDKFEDKFAIVMFGDGQLLKWPIKNLPDDTEVGQQIRLVLSTTQTDEAEREKIAKTILNQILKTKNTDENQAVS